MKSKSIKINIILDVLCLIILISTILFFIIIWFEIAGKAPVYYDNTENIDKWDLKLLIVMLTIGTWIRCFFTRNIKKIS